MKKFFLGWQKPSTEIMEEIIELYDFVMLNMFFLFGIIMFLLIFVIYSFRESKNKIPAQFTHNIKLEILWSIASFLILTIIAFPSIKLIKKIRTIPSAEFSIKITGHQWYWRYTYINHNSIEFDSILDENGLRLLSVDKKLVIPQNTVVRLIFTSADVIHSFFLPSAGIKVDCIPGKLNESFIKIKDIGVYYGQCAELCGASHSFMPIGVEVVSRDDFKKWIENNHF